MATIEFRLPISPTRPFYDRVHFFCAALRRLGGEYATAPVRITVGGAAELHEVKRSNGWSQNYPVEWFRVPTEIFREQGYFGTSDFRYHLPDIGTERIILADADTALVKGFGNEFDWMSQERPCLSGHMAHSPPPAKVDGQAPASPNELWPSLFAEFGIPWPAELYLYSMAHHGPLPRVPAYYNLGMIVLNRPALDIFRREVFPTRDRLNALLTSEMRCQIACTLISYANDMARRNLPAAFNAANDERHRLHHDLAIEDICLIHYLRRGEVDRESFLAGEARHRFLHEDMQNPVNQLLQRLARQLNVDEWRLSDLEQMDAPANAYS